jgi:MraZ protein
VKSAGVKREFFKGFAINAVDAKGRLSIPSGYRATIESRSVVKEVTLSLRFEPNHIRGYDEFYNAHAYDQIASRFAPDQEAERAAALQREFGFVETQAYDTTGRIVLPATIRAAAGIDRLACFVAFADYFEIWDPASLLKSDRADAATKFHVGNLLKERGGSA